jgi:hypothetical protein
MRRRENREHFTLYLKAFNAWAAGTALTQLKYTPRRASAKSLGDAE